MSSMHFLRAEGLNGTDNFRDFTLVFRLDFSFIQSLKFHFTKDFSTKIFKQIFIVADCYLFVINIIVRAKIRLITVFTLLQYQFQIVTAYPMLC